MFSVSYRRRPTCRKFLFAARLATSSPADGDLQPLRRKYADHVRYRDLHSGAATELVQSIRRARALPADGGGGKWLGVGLCGHHELSSQGCLRHHGGNDDLFAQEATGKGVGSLLYSALFEALKDEDINRIVGGYTLPNPASASLHQRFGFKPIGIFTQVGRKFGRYWDVAWNERPAKIG